MVTSSQSPTSPVPPPLGTIIDNGSLRLVEILGYGGYGIVYRAVDTFSSNPTSYAVKCLPHSNKRSAARQRQLHMREIALHQLASGHPNVVTLHRVIEDYQYTYIVMDYCSDGDLFTQILHQRRYLGNNALIKEVFLQLLDAVEYCHSLNIYHRDLKPENILCFEGGLRLAITDFGLATTERMSTEFRTGSVYHMSPECQGGVFAPTRSYSPLFNDVWSLGIILLNLITGRNPWKSASADDCTFQAYLKDPLHFLPTVLPISPEVNLLLTRTLEVDWRHRITLREMRHALKAIDNFYSSDVIFEDSMARCPWEAGLRADPDSEESAEAEPEPRELPEQEPQEDFASAWSNGSDSHMVFARERSVAKDSSWSDSFSFRARDAEGASAGASAYSRSRSASRSLSGSASRSMSPGPDSPVYTTTKLFEALQTPGHSPASAYSVLSSSPSIPSPPVTPHANGDWGQVQQGRPKLVLTVNTDGFRPEYYDNSVTMLSATASSMHTALESALSPHHDGYMYSPLVASSIPTAKASPYPYGDSREDVGMIITPATEDHDMDEYPTIDTPYDSHDSARPESPVLGLDLGEENTRAPAQQNETDLSWQRLCSWLNPSPQAGTSTNHTPAFSFFTVTATTAQSSSQPESVPWPAFSFRTSATSSSPRSIPEKLSPIIASGPPPLPLRTTIATHTRVDRKSRTSSFLKPIRLAFPRRSTSPPRRRSYSRSPGRASGKSRQAHSTPETFSSANWVLSASTSASPEPQPYMCLPPTTPHVHMQTVRTEKEGGVHPTHTTLTEDAQPRRKRLRSARDWFSPGKLFAAVLPSS
ncbi:kinase-like protein [Trametes versicolor FP-101664 SS1]|uniref:kinase-like protein n=1 Tax=Trametes versicolor (strain FP-101664) TaxID=717944 RepID=UPI0004624257|nr:kinase-like protein [Trametes versicolor FP-101664 SS1]EIW55059.1 kinase-like protein [Trametes versicolor FP-101664 SS1]